MPQVHNIYRNVSLTNKTSQHNSTQSATIIPATAKIRKYVVTYSCIELSMRFVNLILIQFDCVVLLSK